MLTVKHVVFALQERMDLVIISAICAMPANMELDLVIISAICVMQANMEQAPA